MNKALLVCILILGAQPLAAETYKWVNEDGVVTYSQTPPPNQEAERIKLRSPTQDDAQSSQTRLDNLRQQLADSAEDRALKKQEQQKTDETQKLKRQNCEAAQSNLRKLEAMGTRIVNTDGEYRRLPEEERQKLMEQEKAHIKANCGK